MRGRVSAVIWTGLLAHVCTRCDMVHCLFDPSPCYDNTTKIKTGGLHPGVPTGRIGGSSLHAAPQCWFVDAGGNSTPPSDPHHHDKEHFIKLHRNLYGCKQATYNWYHHLTKGTLSQGFKQSNMDPCLYICHDCIMILYTDDTLIFAKDDSPINEFIRQLSHSYTVEDQGAINNFLGIRITRDESTKTITVTQPDLIESIRKDPGLSSSNNTKYTPSDNILHRDPTSTPQQDSWNNRSIIGKLNFLAQNTRPDISFSVHQCARFCTTPTMLHELAVKRIARYLL